jgi:hypothetical protein
MPTTSPAALTSGPPELPDEIAASVWIRPSSAPSAGRGCDRGPTRCRGSPTGPPSRSSAKPIATTSSPIRIESGSAKTAGVKPSPAMRRSARSLPASAASSVAGRGSVSPASRTRISVAPSTTCAFVRISPSDVVITPVPIDPPRPSLALDIGADRHHRRRHELGDGRHVDRDRHASRAGPTSIGRSDARCGGSGVRTRPVATTAPTAAAPISITAAASTRATRRPVLRGANAGGGGGSIPTGGAGGWPASNDGAVNPSGRMGSDEDGGEAGGRQAARGSSYGDVTLTFVSRIDRDRHSVRHTRPGTRARFPVNGR